MIDPRDPIVVMPKRVTDEPDAEIHPAQAISSAESYLLWVSAAVIRCVQRVILFWQARASRRQSSAS